MAKKISVREYDRRAEELIRRIRAEAKPFPDDTPEGKVKRRNRARQDFFYFCKTYLPHHFEEDFDRHQKQCEKLIHIWNEIIQIMAFRGWGKSTFFITAYGLYATLYKLNPYIIVVSDTEDQAAEQMLTVKVELEENPRIKQDFGDLQSHDWAEEDFTTTSGVKWKAFGYKSKILGRRYMQYRPGIAFVDDFENEESVKNPAQTKKRLEYIYNQLFPAMAKKFQIFYLCTRLARYCVAGELEKNKEIKTFLLPAENNKGRATCPQRFPLTRLKKVRKVIGIIAYSKQYLLRILSDETRPFQDQWIVRINRPEEKYKRIAAFIDPSVGATRKNDFKSVVFVGWTDKYYDVIYSWIKQASIDRMIRRTYTLYDEIRPHRIGLETNGFQILLKKEFIRAAKEEGFHLPIKTVVQKENKELRIERLSPLVENGLIRFVQGAGDNELLIEQLLDFPDGAHDDGPDALEGAIRLLEQITGRTGETEITII
ncbi:phage uncharacterized protein [Caldithrix abyssi DSM 13497]|uniref:Phage uncharacterized protein n=1 Tax=Caldithrix abyssi DSM 13497 TaxID=880073 RepID=H1XPW2_CALAY|nr:phage terminase large subunit [Caldithrix abyssi]APF20383.1 phage uncharacterized protein (putative large terminase), C-terminal domain-containing protein [Caldithrix abyssi DSM 13497]EHO41088.1 phage uncharacterized protein [Caldithrix abyssi DSM 13497]